MVIGVHVIGSYLGYTLLYSSGEQAAMIYDGQIELNKMLAWFLYLTPIVLYGFFCFIFVVLQISKSSNDEWSGEYDHLIIKVLKRFVYILASLFHCHIHLNIITEWTYDEWQEIQKMAVVFRNMLESFVFLVCYLPIVIIVHRSLM